MTKLSAAVFDLSVVTQVTALQPWNAKVYQQCGGQGYSGPITCEAGSYCAAVAPPWYYQCLPGTGPVTTTTTATTTTTTTPTCPQHQTYSPCGTLCPRNCHDKDDVIACPPACNAGCFCTSGRVLDDNGNCILKEECPIVTTVPTTTSATTDILTTSPPEETTDVTSTTVATTTADDTPTTTITTATITTARSTTTTRVIRTQSQYGQCAGVNWPGPYRCLPGDVCKEQGQHYGQCVPMTATPTPSPSPFPNLGEGKRGDPCIFRWSTLNSSAPATCTLKYRCPEPMVCYLNYGHVMPRECEVGTCELVADVDDTCGRNDPDNRKCKIGYWCSDATGTCVRDYHF